MSLTRRGIVLPFALLATFAVAMVAYGQASPAPSALTPAQVQQPVTLFQMLKWAGMVGYILVALSITTLALVFKHVFALRRTALMPPRVIDRIEQLISQKKIKEAMDFCKADESTLGKMMGAGLGELRHGYEGALQTMQKVGGEEALKHNTGISVFGMIANVGPMLGLLGTVSGMVTTFNKIAQAVSLVKAPQLAEGIQEALVNTVLGLAVAIPNVCVFTLLKNRVTRMFLQLSVMSEELLSPLKAVRIVSGLAPPVAAQPASPLPPRP